MPLPLPYDGDAGHRVILADGYDAIQDETSSPLAPNAARYLLPAIYVLDLLQKLNKNTNSVEARVSSRHKFGWRVKRSKRSLDREMKIVCTN